MRRLTVVLAGLMALAGGAQAQSPFSFEFHGFVNPHFYADSRQVMGGREEMMLFYPKPVVRDAAGYDINGEPQADLLSITTRLNVAVHGPDMLGAKTMAFVEGDFTGSTNASNNDLRLRHAYLQLDWGHSRLLGGQYWHPMVVHEIMPNTRPLNMGAPFHPYARYNQVRYTGRLKNWEAIAVALYQQDNMSQGLLDGVVTSSTQFQRRAVVPELHLQLRYNGERLLAGGAANMLTLRPRIYTDATLVPPGPQHGLYRSFSYTLFVKYRFDGWAVSAQALLNNSLYEVCSMGGYLLPAVADRGTCMVEGIYPWHFNTAWIDFGRTQGRWRPGLFAGYGKRMLPTDINYETGQHYAIGRGFDIEYLWRLQPRLGYHHNEAFNIYVEAEYTFAQYLKKELSADIFGNYYAYTHDPDGGVGNLRLMVSAEYRW
ncbi:MAG: hypothetical protein IJM88_00410 [Bacteroidales bacterium]|nr:hypothetical protein [Bacteroidales bacterium]